MRRRWCSTFCTGPGPQTVGLQYWLLGKKKKEKCSLASHLQKWCYKLSYILFIQVVSGTKSSAPEWQRKFCQRVCTKLNNHLKSHHRAHFDEARLWRLWSTRISSNLCFQAKNQLGGGGSQFDSPPPCVSVLEAPLSSSCSKAVVFSLDFRLLEAAETTVGFDNLQFDAPILHEAVSHISVLFFCCRQKMKQIFV